MHNASKALSIALMLYAGASLAGCSNGNQTYEKTTSFSKHANNKAKKSTVTKADKDKQDKEDRYRADHDNYINPNHIAPSEYDDKTTDEYLNDYTKGITDKKQMCEALENAAKARYTYNNKEEYSNEAKAFVTGDSDTFWKDDDSLKHTIYYGAYTEDVFTNKTSIGKMGKIAKEIGEEIYTGESTKDSKNIKEKVEKMKDEMKDYHEIIPPHA